MVWGSQYLTPSRHHALQSITITPASRLRWSLPSEKAGGGSRRKQADGDLKFTVHSQSCSDTRILVNHALLEPSAFRSRTLCFTDESTIRPPDGAAGRSTETKKSGQARFEGACQLVALLRHRCHRGRGGYRVGRAVARPPGPPGGQCQRGGRRCRAALRGIAHPAQ
jgi:hypothetical protein